MPKSCLKIPTPPMTPGDDCCHRRKCVAFSAEDLEQVYIADEWDRTPAEVAHKLSYGDVLELKAIQRSLPTAAQLPDPLARRPHAQYLKQVPIGLLPLFDDTQPCNSVAPAPPELPPIPSRLPSCPSNLDSISSIYSPRPSKAPSQSISPLLAPTNSTPTSPPSRRPKPSFAFLPLLDTPEPPPSTEPSIPPPSDNDTDDSDHDLSTPALSTASLDTTPSPRDLSDSEEAHGYFHLPPRRKETSSSYFPRYPPAPSHKCTAGAPPTNSTPFSLYPPNTTVRSKNSEPRKPPQNAADSQTFDVNGETYHFGPMSSPPDHPLAYSPPLSPLSLPARLPLQSSPPKKYIPFFPLQERGQDMQQPSYASYSRPATSRNQSPSPKSSTGTRTKELHPSSPILSPYIVSMKRATGGSLCSSPSNSLVGMSMVRSEAMVGGGKGSLEH